MKYPEYFRQRVITTLWSFGFSFFSFVYCFAILSTNDFHLSGLHSFNQFLPDKSNESPPSQYVLGFIILCTYFAHSGLWEGSQSGCNEAVYYNLLFMVLFMFTYVKG